MYASLPGLGHECIEKEGFAVFRSFGYFFVAPLTAALLSEVGSDGSHAW